MDELTPGAVPRAAMAITVVRPGIDVPGDIKLTHTDYTVSTAHYIAGFRWKDVASCGRVRGGDRLLC